MTTLPDSQAHHATGYRTALIGGHHRDGKRANVFRAGLYPPNGGTGGEVRPRSRRSDRVTPRKRLIVAPWARWTLSLTTQLTDPKGCLERSPRFVDTKLTVRPNPNTMTLRSCPRTAASRSRTRMLAKLPARWPLAGSCPKIHGAVGHLGRTATGGAACGCSPWTQQALDLLTVDPRGHGPTASATTSG